MRALLFVAGFAGALTVLGGCASTPTEESASAKDMICTRETPIGTKFPVTKCRTREQVAADKTEAERVKASAMQSSTYKPAPQ